MTAYLRPTAPIASDLLLAADPAIAMAIAHELLERPLMSNHSFGLWGYSGDTAHGRALTVHSTGIGAASVAIVLAELAGHGARRAIRIGELTALDRASASTLVVTHALARDGASAALGCSGEVAPDRELTERLLSATEGVGAGILSADPGPQDRDREARAAGALASDYETAALLAAASSAGVAAAAAFAAATASAEDDRSPSADLLALARAAAAVLAEP